MKGKTAWLSACTFLLACSSAMAIYLTHPRDPHDEGLLVASAALLWPFIGFPVAWLTCAIVAVREWRRYGGVRTLSAVAFATVSGLIPFTGYYLNQKPWLSPARQLSDPWPDVRARGAHSLSSEAPKTAVPLLAAALGDPSSEVRSTAASALGKHGDQAASALPALIHALDDEDWFVGCQAGEALSAMRSRSADVLPPLIERLRSSNATRAWCAATALGLLGGDGASAVIPLRSQLAHPDPNVRSAACQALGCAASTTFADQGQLFLPAKG
jgi:HEAT repeat protein